MAHLSEGIQTRRQKSCEDDTAKKVDIGQSRNLVIFMAYLPRVKAPADVKGWLKYAAPMTSART